MKEPKGQILRGSPFGDALYRLCCVKDFLNIVEVGTWRGQGSTRCIMDALLMRHDKSCLWSLETKPEFFEEAKAYWSLALGIYPVSGWYDKLHLIHGRIVEPDELMSIEEIKRDPRFSQHPWLEWRARNIEEYGSCPNVLKDLPERIDVLCLDGGQFSTRVEWERLKDRTQVVLLDDTTTYKTSAVRRDILDDRDFEVVVDVLGERHGYFIGCRRGSGQVCREALGA